LYYYGEIVPDTKQPVVEQPNGALVNYNRAFQKIAQEEAARFTQKSLKKSLHFLSESLNIYSRIDLNY